MYSVKMITENKKAFLPLLLLADPSEEMIYRYLDRGALYALADGDRVVGAAVVTMEGEDLCELKNLAIAESCQGQGYAKLLLENLFFKYAQGFSRMRVGTGEPLRAFYEKMGFVETGVIPGFFTNNYPEPVVDGGETLTDMILLERPLKAGCACCGK